MVTPTLTVWKGGDKHYGTMSPKGKSPLGPSQEPVFTVEVEGQSFSHELTQELQEKARTEARRRGISHVINLD